MMTVVLASFNIILMKLNSMLKTKVIDMMEHIAIKKISSFTLLCHLFMNGTIAIKCNFQSAEAKKKVLSLVVMPIAVIISSIPKTAIFKKHTNNVIANAVREMATKFKLSVYDEKLTMVFYAMS